MCERNRDTSQELNGTNNKKSERLFIFIESDAAALFSFTPHIYILSVFSHFFPHKNLRTDIVIPFPIHASTEKENGLDGNEEAEKALFLIELCGERHTNKGRAKRIIFHDIKNIFQMKREEEK